MSKWEMVRLGDVCVVERGGSPRPIEKFITENANGINWVKIGDTALNDMYITQTKEKIIPEGIRKSRRVKVGDFLLSNSMSFGRPYILKIDGCIHDGWLLIRDEDNIFDKRFLYYFLVSNRTYAELKRLAVGGVVNNLNSSMVRNVKIPLPPMSEQKEISRVLTKVNAVISDRKQQLVELDNLIKSRFVEMFGDPWTNDKGWESGTIRDIVTEVKYGTSKPSKEDGKYPYLRMNNITFNGALDLSDLKYIDITDNEIEKYIARNGDVLFNRTNSKDLVGKTCVFNLEEPMIIAGYIIRIRLNNSKAVPIYLSSVLNSDYGKATLRLLCRNIIGQANINAQELQDIEVLIPPLDIQNRFADFVRQVDKSKFAVQKSLDETQLLFDSLMSRYFD